MNTQPQPEDNCIPAGLGRRLGAMIYDSLLLAATILLAAVVALPFTGKADVGANLFYRFYLFLVIFLYFAWPWVRSGQTLGMQTWRLRLLRLDGSHLTWSQALLRFLAAIPSTLLGLGYLWFLVDKEKHTVHDRIAETMLVFEKKDKKKV